MLLIRAEAEEQRAVRVSNFVHFSLIVPSIPNKWFPFSSHRRGGKMGLGAAGNIPGIRLHRVMILWNSQLQM